MLPKQITTSASALPARPDRPFKYVCPVAASDGSVTFDRPLENYFDASMAHRLLPSLPPSRLYDTVARAYDHRYQLDPSWSTPRPLVLNPRERPRSLANLPGNSPEYLGISSDSPGWRPRRSSYEDRRGAVGVTPSQVNTLVPYIPPIDTSSPPPSREWLDAMAKRFLADAQADLDDYPITVPPPSTHPLSPLESSDSLFFDYDTDTTLDAAIPSPHTTMPRRVPQAVPDTASLDADFNSNSDTESDTDTDTDADTDGGYDWNNPPIPPSGPGARWLIPRKRPSVLIVNNKDVAIHLDPSNDVSHGSHQGHPTPPLLSPDGGHPGKRRRGGKTGYPKRVAKTPKRHANDTPARQCRTSTSQDPQDSSSEHALSHIPARLSPFASDTATSSRPPVSAIAATAYQMKQVRITSPGIASPRLVPQPSIAPSVPPRSPKLFPCLLDGCTQICASAGDLQRHQQSLRHRAPSHNCLACSKSYTRPDALKRHLNSKASCKKEHAAKLSNGPGAQVEEAETEAEEEAVQVMTTISG